MAERKRMLITGVSGLLGNNLARYFRGAFEVLGIYCTHPVAMDRVETRGADIEDPERLARIVRQFQPEVIIHCASLANIDDCEANRERSDRINVLGTRTLAECTPTGAKLVYISSDSVYDGTRGPWRETDPVNPLNYYGVCKYRGEQEAARAAGSLILRTNLFGWNIQPKLSLGEWVLGQLRSGQRLGGFTDARFSTLYTFDLARLMERAIARGLEGVYHCGCRQSLSKYDFAVQTARRFGLDESLVQPTSMDQFGFKAPRGKDLSLCVEKMERDLGQPLPTFEDSLDAFYRDEQEGLPASIRRHNARVASWSTTMGYGRQSLDESDIAAVVEVLCSTHLTQGPKVAEFEEAVAACVGTRLAVAANSGTSALHMACLAAGIGPGDEVITTPITFVASANCVAYCGARPVFADIDPRTYNLRPEALARAITERTRAVIPVHFAGQSCDMAAIHDLVGEAEKRFGHRIYVIEDACHALGSLYGGRSVGGGDFSDMVVLSFHPVKHITTGEGGMVLTRDDGLAHRLRRFRSHGITAKAAEFVNADLGLRPDQAGRREANPWYYEQQDLGYNYRITDMQCALGLAQLKRLDAFRARRRAIVNRYNQAFRGVARMQTPFEADFCDSNFHLYVPLFDFEALKLDRAGLILALRSCGIHTQVHYIPVHLQPYYRKTFGTRPGDCPNAEAYYQRCLTLPLFPAMTDEDVEKVIAAVTERVG